MKLLRSIPVRALLTLVVCGCFEGTGSGIIGIANDSTGVAASTRARGLSFFVQPSTANAGQIMTPPIQVVASDSTGAADTTFTGSVTIALSSNPTAAVLGGTKTVRAVRGLASFASLTIDRVGSYALRASAAGATSVTSQTFIVTTANAR